MPPVARPGGGGSHHGFSQSQWNGHREPRDAVEEPQSAEILQSLMAIAWLGHTRGPHIEEEEEPRRDAVHHDGEGDADDPEPARDEDTWAEGDGA